MLESNQEILLTLGVGTLLLTFFAILVVIAIVKYQNKARIHLEEVNELKVNFQKENLKAKLEIREQTLDMVSKEIHDNIGQVLSLAKLTLYGIDLNDEQSEKLDNSKKLVTRAIKDLKKVSRSLNPKFDDTFSLVERIKEETSLLTQSGQMQVDLNIKGEEPQISPQHTLIVYRVFQEVINNIIKHAEATIITIDLNYHADHGQLVIQDNGKGFQLSEIDDKAGAGLDNLKYRTNVIGGEISIESQIGKGTKVNLLFPNHT